EKVGLPYGILSSVSEQVDEQFSQTYALFFN
ncbi:MAG TPA: metal-dependent phosphohydrolase, partial [Methylococcaceae bacterium]|nr:metal-dependent phosphohydrolase [Methylococcaceae bacterium]